MSGWLAEAGDSARLEYGGDDDRELAAPSSCGSPVPVEELAHKRLGCGVRPLLRGGTRGWWQQSLGELADHPNESSVFIFETLVIGLQVRKSLQGRSCSPTPPCTWRSPRPCLPWPGTKGASQLQRPIPAR